MKAWNRRTAQDVMRYPVLSLGAETTLHEAASWMSDNEISGAPVLDHTGRPVGVVSLFDIVTFLSGLDVPKGGFYRNSFPRFGDGDDAWEKDWEEIEPDALKTTPVSEIMTTTIVTIPRETPLPDVAERMSREHIHRLFVTNGEELVGVISTMDILNSLSDVHRSVPAGRLPA